MLYNKQHSNKYQESIVNLVFSNKKKKTNIDFIQILKQNRLYRSKIKRKSHSMPRSNYVIIFLKITLIITVPTLLTVLFFYISRPFLVQYVEVRGCLTRI